MVGKFSEFSKFKESDKSVKHEFESIKRSLSCVLLLLWYHLGHLHKELEVQITFFFLQYSVTCSEFSEEFFGKLK